MSPAARKELDLEIYDRVEKDVTEKDAFTAAASARRLPFELQGTTSAVAILPGADMLPGGADESPALRSPSGQLQLLQHQQHLAPRTRPVHDAAPELEQSDGGAAADAAAKRSQETTEKAKRNYFTPTAGWTRATPANVLKARPQSAQQLSRRLAGALQVVTASGEPGARVPALRDERRIPVPVGGSGRGGVLVAGAGEREQSLFADTIKADKSVPASLLPVYEYFPQLYKGAGSGKTEEDHNLRGAPDGDTSATESGSASSSATPSGPSGAATPMNSSSTAAHWNYIYATGGLNLRARDAGRYNHQEFLEEKLAEKFTLPPSTTVEAKETRDEQLSFDVDSVNIYNGEAGGAFLTSIT
eukprot:g15835.t1